MIAGLFPVYAEFEVPQARYVGVCGAYFLVYTELFPELGYPRFLEFLGVWSFWRLVSGEDEVLRAYRVHCDPARGMPVGVLERPGLELLHFAPLRLVAEVVPDFYLPIIVLEGPEGLSFVGNVERFSRFALPGIPQKVLFLAQGRGGISHYDAVGFLHDAAGTGF